MSVLVTGGTGRLGQALIGRLLAEGRSVRILTRRPFRAAELYGDRVGIHEWHPLSEDVPEEALSGVTAIAHLMAEPLWGRTGASKLERIRVSRLTPTAKLVAALGQRRVRLVMASMPPLSSSPSPEAEEQQDHAPDATPLSAIMRTHEDAAGACREQGSSLAIVRLGLVLGPDELLSPLTRLARWRACPALEGSLIPVIDIEDAAALFAGLLDQPVLEGVVNGVAPEPLRGEDLVKLVTQSCGVAPRVVLPRRLTRRIFGELSHFLLNRTPVTPRRLLEAGALFACPDPKISIARMLAEQSRGTPSRPLRVWPFAKVPRVS